MSSEDDVELLKLQGLDSGCRVMFCASGQIPCDDRLLSNNNPVLWTQEYSGVHWFWNGCQGFEMGNLFIFYFWLKAFSFVLVWAPSVLILAAQLEPGN